MGFILKLAVHILVSAGAIYLIDVYIFGEAFSITGEGYERYIAIAIMLGLMNVLVKPLLKILLIPIKILTLGFAGLAVNGIILGMLSYALALFEVSAVGIEVDSWITYLFAGMAIGFANMIVNWFD